MKQKYQLYFYFVGSIILSTFLWEYISIPLGNEKKNIIEGSLEIQQNPINDIIRFIIFLLIPFSTIILFYQITEKKFFTNLRKVLFFDERQVNLRTNDFELKIYFFCILIFLILEFLSLDFLTMNYKVDFFHEGMWLSASQNTKSEGGFWSTSYIVRGFFGEFYPYFLWKFFDLETIGITRFSNIIILFLNKILLLLIVFRLTTLSNLKKNFKVFYFLLLCVSFLSLQGYGAPIFTPRSFLFLTFIYIFLNFLKYYNKTYFFVILIGLFSSISFFWYIDIGVYINALIFILLLFFLFKFELKNFLLLIFSIIFGWVFFYIFISSDEFREFTNNTFLIFKTLNYIHDLVFPTPFLSFDSRSLKAILLFLFSGLLIIKLINSCKENEHLSFFISILFLYLVSCLYFNYGLSRSDGPHIRIATGYIFITFFTVGLFYFFKKFEYEKKVFKFAKIINYFLILIVLLSVFVNKKYENKSVFNLKKSFKEINELILFEDEKYMSKEYIKLVSYFGNLIKKDKCATIFTNETALYYFLKKPSCSKFYYMWTATPLVIQEKIIKKIYERKPTFILYKSDQDIFYNSDKSLKIVNQFILNNYSFYEKFSHWEIYKIK